MSLDFQPSHGLYPQQDYMLDQQDQIDNAEHPTYPLFPDQRYRPAASPVAPQYADQMYAQQGYQDGFGASNYELMGPMGSGKVSPLTPADSIHHQPGFSGKDYSPQSFGDLHDRRLPTANGNGYHSEYSDDYAMGSQMPFNGMPQFQDRLSRLPHDRYQHPNGAPAPLPGVAPHATHAFKDGGYEEIPPYLPPQDMRMHALDEHLIRMRLHPPQMGASSDLQTFIRYVFSTVCLAAIDRVPFSPFLDQYVRTQNRLAFGERTVIVMSSKVAQKSYGTEKRSASPHGIASLVPNKPQVPLPPTHCHHDWQLVVE